MKRISILLLGFLSIMQTSQAALTDIGGGFVNDSSLNITWLKDANMVNTLCKANDPIWQSWAEPVGNLPPGEDSGRTKIQICTDSVGAPFTAGLLNWYEAENWMAHLNTNNYLGHNDWRQPTTTQPDTSCESTFVVGQNGGYNCRESELGHLFNTSLANPNHGGTGISVDPAKNGVVGTACAVGAFGPAPARCFQNVGPFSHAHSFAYWSGSSYAPNPINAWNFSTTFGYQNFGLKDNVNLYVWPVRSGQSVVAAVQPIPTLSVWGLGLMVILMGVIVRRKVW